MKFKKLNVQLGFSLLLFAHLFIPTASLRLGHRPFKPDYLQQFEQPKYESIESLLDTLDHSKLTDRFDSKSWLDKYIDNDSLSKHMNHYSIPYRQRYGSYLSKRQRLETPLDQVTFRPAGRHSSQPSNEPKYESIESLLDRNMQRHNGDSSFSEDWLNKYVDSKGVSYHSKDSPEDSPSFINGVKKLFMNVMGLDKDQDLSKRSADNKVRPFVSMVQWQQGLENPDKFRKKLRTSGYKLT